MKTSLLTMLLLVGCSSANKTVDVSDSHLQPDQVLSRMGEASSRPDWVNEGEAQPFIVKNGQVAVISSTSIPAGHRLESAYRIAENSAKGSLAGIIESRLSFILQNAEEGTSMDGNQLRYIGAEASNLVSSNIRPQNRYWEKVATTQENGSRTVIQKVFVSVTMPELDFKNAILAAIHKQQGKKGISQEFARKLDAHWDEFTKEDDSKVQVATKQ